MMFFYIKINKFTIFLLKINVKLFELSQKIILVQFLVKTCCLENLICWN